MKHVYTPCWKDDKGVVHIIGTHTRSRIWTECLHFIAGQPDNQEACYQESFEPPTCIQCIGDSIDYIPRGHGNG